MALVAVSGLLLAPVVQAEAAVINYGVDVVCNNYLLAYPSQVHAHSCNVTDGVTATQVKDVPTFGPDNGSSDPGHVKGDGFYNGQPRIGGNDGPNIQGINLNKSYTFNIITSGLTGLSIVAASLFVDANTVANTVNVSLFDEDTASFVLLGALQQNGQASDINATFTPVKEGPVGAQEATPYSGDIDNTFFNVPVSLWDEIIDGSLTVKVESGVGFARLDGVNLQIDAIEDLSGSAEDTGGVPEPATMLLLGSGLLAAGIGSRFARGRGRK
jgi:hypothetical protein